MGPYMYIVLAMSALVIFSCSNCFVRYMLASYPEAREALFSILGTRLDMCMLSIRIC